MIRSEVTEGSIPATSMMMAADASDPNPTCTQNLVSTTPEIDVSQETGTRFTQELRFDDSLQEEFTPATALDFALDLDYLTNLPECNDDLDQIDWDDYYSSAVNDNALEASQHGNDLDGEDHKEVFLEPGFDASAAKPASDSLPGFPYDHNDEAASTQIASTQEPNLIFQDTIDPGDLSVCAIKDLSDLFGTSSPSGRDLDLSFPGNFELPDHTPGLEFLESLHLMCGESKSAISPAADYNIPERPHLTGRRAVQDRSSTADRVISAGSSEPNLKAQHSVVLTKPRRLFKGQQGTQRRHYIPNTAYTPLNQAPKKWDIFEYTRDGELDPSRLFSAEEINRFLFNHPLHSGHHNPKEGQLKLRVHKTPAGSAKRFPNGLRCRFKDCPMRTINQGQLLVMVDELSVQHPNHDLFLNASYFHLWCMERYCDFEEICVNLDVTAKGRDARWEHRRKNRFCLGSEEERVVEDWVEACRAHGRRGFGGKPWVTHACPDQPNGCPHFDPPSLSYKGTLCHQLTVTKLHYGGQSRIALRKDREDRAGYEGANIMRHLGDLSKEAELREFSRSHRNQNQLKLNPKTGRRYRVDGDEINEQEQSGYSRPETNHQQTHEPPAVVSSYQARGTKRSRDGPCDSQTLNHDIVQTYKKARYHGPILNTPIWNDNQGQNFCSAGTPGISPHTTLAPKFQRTPSQVQTTSTSPQQDGQSASIPGLRLTTSEDESEGEIELAILAAQRRRRLLEIEDAKDNEKECRLRKLKLQEASQKKRSRREEDDDDDRRETDSRGKRQRI